MKSLHTELARGGGGGGGHYITVLCFTSLHNFPFAMLLENRHF